MGNINTSRIKQTHVFCKRNINSDNVKAPPLTPPSMVPVNPISVAPLPASKVVAFYATGPRRGFAPLSDSVVVCGNFFLPLGAVCLPAGRAKHKIHKMHRAHISRCILNLFKIIFFRTTKKNIYCMNEWCASSL